VFNEELVLVTAIGHPPVHAPRDLQTRTMLAFQPGCPHRQRLEQWLARGRVMPERVVETSSYHAILGCAVVGMGVGLMPRSVIDAYAERGRLAVHPLTGAFKSARTLLAWRRESPQARVTALRALFAPVRGASRSRAAVSR
jgi:DNA-binding transcriptional LysR family regulator